MTTELAIRQLSPDTLQMIMQVAPTMHMARLFGTASAEQAAAIMLKGFELGFSITASFENIHVIEGKPSLSPRGALALIHGCGELAGITVTDELDAKGAPTACAVTMKRRNGFEYTARFSMDDAKRAGLVKPNSGWEKYPANMLRYRAIGYAADIVFPDVIGGTKRADEYGADLTADGDVIEGSWQTPQGGSQPQQPQQPAASPVSQKPMTLAMLSATYTPSEIMAINGGKIPQTPEECAVVADKLANRKPAGTDLSLDVDMGGVMSNGSEAK